MAVTPYMAYLVGITLDVSSGVRRELTGALTPASTGGPACYRIGDWARHVPGLGIRPVAQLLERAFRTGTNYASSKRRTRSGGSRYR